MSNPYLEAMKRGAIRGAKNAPRDFLSPVLFTGWLVRKGLNLLSRRGGCTPAQQREHSPAAGRH